MIELDCGWHSQKKGCEVSEEDSMLFQFREDVAFEWVLPSEMIT